ncbi:helix-turn-helix transcriptional regulator [Ruegeria conchae]|uniref:helix-turn-helix domain-containing protein n=1 Tax=Ruegeria conchae TaxID=981384 RepID=UPI0029C6A6EA|nr:helix-turn-helix transcriptional regulator [Ruegeria conchae]
MSAHHGCATWVECILKPVDLKPTLFDPSGVKRTPKSPLRDVFAKNVRLARAERGLSQEKLAHEAGLNRTYLSAVERSEQSISLDNVHRIAVALGTSAWKLLAE